MVVATHGRRIVNALLVAAIALVLPAGAAADQVGLAKVLKKFTVKKPDGKKPTDFHVKIHSNDHKLHVDSVDGGSFNSNGLAGQDTNDLTIDFFGDALEAEDNTFRITLKQQDNAVHITDVFWTTPGFIRAGDVKIDGFKVQDDPLFTIFNDLADPFGVRNLQFLVNVPEMSDAALVPGSTPGFGATFPDFVLQPGGFMTFNTPGVIDPGNFMYAQGLIYDVTSGETTGAFIDGHQASPVPEPTTLLLLGAGAAMTAVRKRIRGSLG